MSGLFFKGKIMNESFSEKDAEKVVRAFWRRIYDYRNDYGKELPEDCPVEFVANMATALTALKAELVGYTNSDQIAYAKDSEGSFYPDTDCDCNIKLIAMEVK